MRKIIICIMLCFCHVCGFAQIDTELQNLINLVVKMRKSTEAVYNSTVEKLRADQQWTAMTETGDLRQEECRPTKSVACFRFNSVMTNAEKKRKHISTRGDMISGEDTRYHYSMIERIVKPGQSVAYTLKGREGEQTFAIVPYKQKGSLLSVTLNAGKTTATQKVLADGTILLTCPSKKLVREDKLTLTVKNGSKSAQAFVIINHNTGKR